MITNAVIKTEKERTTYLDGDIYILGDAVAVINKSTVTFFQSGMEYLVASNEVNTLELLKMAYSLIVYQEK